MNEEPGKGEMMNGFFGWKKKQNSTTVAVKKQNITTVAAIIIKKRLNSHPATLKKRQKNIYPEKIRCTGTHHSEVWRTQRQRNRNEREMQRGEGREDTYMFLGALKREARNSLSRDQEQLHKNEPPSLSLSETHTLSLSTFAPGNLSPNRINSEH